MKHSYIYSFFILVLLLACYNREPFVNTYDPNEVSPDEPDSVQFYPCKVKNHDNRGYPFEEYPNSNYKIKENHVMNPLKGSFSAFLDVNKIRTYDHFFHAPICEDSSEFETDVTAQFRLIPGAFPEEDINEIYKEEERKDSHDLRNPYYLHGNPDYLENTILYDEELQEMFLKVKEDLPKYNADDYHMELDHLVDRHEGI